MPRIDPIAETEISEEIRERFVFIEQVMGFVPNSLKTMARIPGLVKAFTDLSSVVLGNDILPAELRSMVSLMVSSGAECRYCQAHSTSSAARAGVSDQKLSDIWNFETSDLFPEPERVALRFAFHAGQIPNAVTDQDMEALREHYESITTNKKLLRLSLSAHYLAI